MKRNNTKIINIGNVSIGGNNKILIQSMTNTDTKNVLETVKQIKKLEKAGCEIIRISIPDMDSAEAIKEIKKNISIPLVADIHFDHRLALKSIENGIDKIRINPGNINNYKYIEKIVFAAKEKNIPIRIGVNSGSLEKNLLEKYNGITAEGLVESAIDKINLISEDFNYKNLVVSIKSSSVPLCIEAYKLISERVDFPLHIGITEAGTVKSGTIKSAIGIGSILSQGIGNTIRVSLTGDPIKEVECAKEILKNLHLRKFGIEFVSCPTCARTKVDLISIANKVESLCENINKNIKVAVMGCAVNGPGEAKDADIGIASGKGMGLIFKKGKIIHNLPENKLVDVLIEEIKKI